MDKCEKQYLLKAKYIYKGMKIDITVLGCSKSNKPNDVFYHFTGILHIHTFQEYVVTKSILLRHTI